MLKFIHINANRLLKVNRYENDAVTYKNHNTSTALSKRVINGDQSPIKN